MLLNVCKIHLLENFQFLYFLYRHWKNTDKYNDNELHVKTEPAAPCGVSCGQSVACSATEQVYREGTAGKEVPKVSKDMLWPRKK